MTKANIKKLIDYWIKGSKLDFESAESIAYDSKRYVQSCFFLHLSIEKILKAYIVKITSTHAPYVHNLPQLGRMSQIELTKDQLKFLVEVNEFNLRCRYPDESYSIYKKATANKTKKLLNQAKEFIDWISKKLKD